MKSRLFEELRRLTTSDVVVTSTNNSFSSSFSSRVPFLSNFFSFFSSSSSSSSSSSIRPNVFFTFPSSSASTHAASRRRFSSFATPLGDFLSDGQTKEGRSEYEGIVVEESADIVVVWGLRNSSLGSLVELWDKNNEVKGLGVVIHFCYSLSSVGILHLLSSLSSSSSSSSLPFSHSSVSPMGVSSFSSSRPSRFLRARLLSDFHFEGKEKRKEEEEDGEKRRRWRSCFLGSLDGGKIVSPLRGLPVRLPPSISSTNNNTSIAHNVNVNNNNNNRKNRNIPSLFRLPSPPSVIHSLPFRRCLPTSNLSVDLLFPLIRGQRISFIGPLGTGKSSLSLSVIASQFLDKKKNSSNRRLLPLPSSSSSDMFVVFVSLSPQNQFSSYISNLHQLIDSSSSSSVSSKSDDEQKIDNSNLLIIHSPPEDSLTLRYLAPLVGFHAAVNAWEEGLDVLFVVDDICIHTNICHHLIESMKNVLNSSNISSLLPSSQTTTTSSSVVIGLPHSASSIHSAILGFAGCYSNSPSFTSLAIVDDTFEEGKDNVAAAAAAAKAVVVPLADSCIYFSFDNLMKGGGGENKISNMSREIRNSFVDIRKLLGGGRSLALSSFFESSLLRIAAREVCAKIRLWEEERHRIENQKKFKIFIDFWEEEELNSLYIINLIFTVQSTSRLFCSSEIFILARAVCLFFFPKQNPSLFEVLAFQKNMIRRFISDYPELWQNLNDRLIDEMEEEEEIHSREGRRENDDIVQKQEQEKSFLLSSSSSSSSSSLILNKNRKEKEIKNLRFLKIIDNAILSYQNTFELTRPRMDE